MKKVYVQFVLCLFLISGVASAHAAGTRAEYSAPASKEETTGFFSGIVLGGLAGGPPGLIVGGALGALLGDGWHARKEVGDLQVDLYSAQLEVAMMRERNAILQQEHQLARQQLDNVKLNAPQYQQAALITDPQRACCDNTVLSLNFRSGSAAIETHYEEQLASLIRVAAQMPAVLVEITGYADRNGDGGKNLQLSRERSESVRRFLQAHGISDTTITTIAYGETKPLQSEQNMEGDFFDRRVIVRLRATGQQLLTGTPDPRQ